MGAEARVLGHGGIRAVAHAAGVSETTVRKGVDELEAGQEPLGRVGDFIHVKTWSAAVYAALIVDTLLPPDRRLVCWSAATVKETVFVLDSPEMAILQGDCDQHSIQPGELIHHSDAGSQLRFAEHLDAAGIAASIGSVGDAYHNAR